MKKSKSPLIALFGPDGSGKSTVAQGIIAQLNKKGINAIRMHWRPGFFPYRHHSSNEDGDLFKDPHLRKMRRGINGFLIFYYIVFDFIIGYYFKVRPHLTNGTIVVYERYYYDIIIDQRRYGLEIPLWFRLFMSYFIPTPDIIILLDASSAIVQKRKREIEPEEIERQRLIMKHFLSRYSCFYSINVEINLPDEVADIIIRKINL